MTIADRYECTAATAGKKHKETIDQVINQTRERVEEHGTSFEKEFWPVLEEMSESPPPTPTPTRTTTGKKGYEVSAYLAKITKAHRSLRELLGEADTVLYWLGEQLPDFIERAEEIAELATALADTLRGGAGITEMAIPGTAREIKPKELMARPQG